MSRCPVSLRVHRRRRGHRPVGVVAPAVGRRRHLAADAGTSASGGADAALHGAAAGRADPPAEEDGGSRRARRRIQGTPTRFIITSYCLEYLVGELVGRSVPGLHLSGDALDIQVNHGSPDG